MLLASSVNIWSLERIEENYVCPLDPVLVCWWLLFCLINSTYKGCLIFLSHIRSMIVGYLNSVVNLRGMNLKFSIHGRVDEQHFLMVGHLFLVGRKRGRSITDTVIMDSINIVQLIIDNVRYVRLNQHDKATILTWVQPLWFCCYAHLEPNWNKQNLKESSAQRKYTIEIES